MTRFYHQLGHRAVWSLDSILRDNAGDGAILAPRYMPPAKITALAPALRRRSLFDPQFFLPGTSRGKLVDYQFYPSIIADGFSSTEYDEETAVRSASLCLAFQNRHDFEHLIIPTRIDDSGSESYIRSQMQLFVDPFLQAYRDQGSAGSLLLQLILSDRALKDEAYRSAILNWVTSLQDLAGVYLITVRATPRKQLQDIDLLLATLRMTTALRDSGLQVILGYLNTEALPLLVADPTGIATGSYENLRKFSVRAFEPADGAPQRGPNARIYLPRLCQWIAHQYVGAITREISDVEAYFGESPYRIEMFSPSYNWHFTKPQPYKHYFHVFSGQIRSLSSLRGSDRFDAVIDTIERARAEFQRLGDAGIVFDADSDDQHLAAWLTALNQFRRERGL